MGTRSLIMIQNNKVIEENDKLDNVVWAEGTYHHYDGNPAILGSYLIDGWYSNKQIDEKWAWLNNVLHHQWRSLPFRICMCCNSKGIKINSKPRTNLDDNWDIEWVYLFSNDHDGAHLEVIKGNDFKKLNIIFDIVLDNNPTEKSINYIHNRFFNY